MAYIETSVVLQRSFRQELSRLMKLYDSSELSLFGTLKMPWAPIKGYDFDITKIMTKPGYRT